MSNWVILVGKLSDIDHGMTGHKVLPIRTYLARPELFGGLQPKIINLARSYSYQSRGYYASLLAAARGHRVMPSVETIVDLSSRELYQNAIPELEDNLNRALKEDGGTPENLLVFFGQVGDPRLERFGRQVFDWFRAPALRVTLTPGEWVRIKKIDFANYGRFSKQDWVRFYQALDSYSGRVWRDSKVKTPSRYTFATLVDQKEELPPSSVSSLKHWARIAQRMGADVEPIGKKDLSRLANYDALFIRETTSPSNHTYRFARRAEQEGMPVIDDSVSMLRCTNKVYLNEVMVGNGIPVPPTLILANKDDTDSVEDNLGYPMVLKIPDSSFSRGVFKVTDPPALKKLTDQWFRETDLLIAQKFMPTEFDWRIGVLGGHALFAVQYLMASKHWQIVHHRDGRKPLEGGFRTVGLGEAPPRVLDVALRAARCIGDGLYGVDVKETPDGVYVIEVNDNPNLDHGVEDRAEKDEVWHRLTRWFIDRLETHRT